jgi:predicted  nucleic acid-binding Zn-ribbon protein
MNKKIITSRITTRQIEQDVEARIAKIRKRIQGMLLEESRIPSAVEDDAIKRYTTLVLDEIRAAKKEARFYRK